MNLIYLYLSVLHNYCSCDRYFANYGSSNLFLYIESKKKSNCILRVRKNVLFYATTFVHIQFILVLLRGRSVIGRLYWILSCAFEIMIVYADELIIFV